MLLIPRMHSFVCALEASNMRFPELLRSYPAPGQDAIKCEIWEAARATSAAPTFFKEVNIKHTGGATLRFVDGALKCSNPVAIVMEEAEKVFGGDKRLGCIVSLGCGVKPAIRAKKPAGYQKVVFIDMLKAIRDIATDCQLVADSTARRFRERPNYYYRFNTPDIGQLSLAEWDSMNDMVSHTRCYCEDPEVSKSIDQVVEILCARKEDTREGETGSLTLAQLCEL